MKINELHELGFGVLAEKFFLLCSWVNFMFILLHVVHFGGFVRQLDRILAILAGWTPDFMNYMKIYEAGKFNGFFLVCPSSPAGFYELREAPCFIQVH